MINKLTFLLITLLLISSCSWWSNESKDILSSEFFMSTYTQENRGVNLSNMNLSGFISLNGLNGTEEIVNIDISDNNIEVLNISEYKDLWRLRANNNTFDFFTDIKFPTQIRHIELANNELETLDWIENLTELKTLDVSYNKLDEEDFKKLANLESLQLIYAQWNNVSEDFLSRLDTFNAPYLRSIKQ